MTRLLSEAELLHELSVTKLSQYASAAKRDQKDQSAKALHARRAAHSEIKTIDSVKDAGEMRTKRTNIKALLDAGRRANVRHTKRSEGIRKAETGIARKLMDRAD